MKNFSFFILGFIIVFLTFNIDTASAQCAMCASTVESSVQNGDKAAEGLNKGVFVLLSAPYLAVAALGFLWYKKYRRKDVKLNMRNDKLNMN